MEIDSIVLKKISANPRPKCESSEYVSETSVAYCFHCSILYCQTCWVKHQGILLTKAHQSIPLEDVLQKIKKNEEKPVASQPNERNGDVIEASDSRISGHETEPRRGHCLQWLCDRRREAEEGPSSGRETQGKHSTAEKESEEWHHNYNFAKLQQVLDKRKCMCMLLVMQVIR